MVRRARLSWSTQLNNGFVESGILRFPDSHARIDNAIAYTHFAWQVNIHDFETRCLGDLCEESVRSDRDALQDAVAENDKCESSRPKAPFYPACEADAVIELERCVVRPSLSPVHTLLRVSASETIEGCVNLKIVDERIQINPLLISCVLPVHAEVQFI